MSKKRFLRAVRELFDGKVNLVNTEKDNYSLVLENNYVEKTVVRLNDDGLQKISSLAKHYGFHVVYYAGYKELKLIPVVKYKRKDDTPF